MKLLNEIVHSGMGVRLPMSSSDSRWGQISHNIISLCLIYHIIDERPYEKPTRCLREAYEKPTRSLREAYERPQQPTSSELAEEGSASTEAMRFARSPVTFYVYVVCLGNNKFYSKHVYSQTISIQCTYTDTRHLIHLGREIHRLAKGLHPLVLHQGLLDEEGDGLALKR